MEWGVSSIRSCGDLRLRDVLAADDSARGVVAATGVVAVPGEERAWGEMEGVLAWDEGVLGALVLVPPALGSSAWGHSSSR